jgi:hypothetical protein
MRVVWRLHIGREGGENVQKEEWIETLFFVFLASASLVTILIPMFIYLKSIGV